MGGKGGRAAGRRGRAAGRRAAASAGGGASRGDDVIMRAARPGPSPAPGRLPRHCHSQIDASRPSRDQAPVQSVPARFFTSDQRAGGRPASSKQLAAARPQRSVSMATRAITWPLLILALLSWGAFLAGIICLQVGGVRVCLRRGAAAAARGSAFRASQPGALTRRARAAGGGCSLARRPSLLLIPEPLLFIPEPLQRWHHRRGPAGRSLWLYPLNQHHEPRRRYG